MESVQFGSVNNSGLVSKEHSFAIIETVDHNSPGVSEPDLKDGLLILVPPFLEHSVRLTLELEVDRKLTSQTVA